MPTVSESQYFVNVGNCLYQSAMSVMIFYFPYDVYDVQQLLFVLEFVYILIV